VWADEFDGNGAVDGSKWRHVVAGDGFGNNELQFYTNRTDNSWVSGGTLKIRARLENWGGREFTSAKLESTGHWTYGKVSVRSRQLGTARGTWAAHWMMPRDSAYGGWPHSGEIDIMEHVGYDTGKFHGTVHTGAYHHSIGTQVGGSTDVPATAWHTWTMEWRPDIILFAADEEVYRVFRKEGPDTEVWPFNQRFFAILNLAVGGDWGGQQGIDRGALSGEGQMYEVDWVKVEQKGAGGPSPSPSPAPSPSPTPSPSPSPSPSPGGYTQRSGLNCYPGMGADLVPGVAEPAAQGMSLAQCQAMCSNNAQCTAVVMANAETAGGTCFLRSNVHESSCAPNSPYSTYLKTGGGGGGGPCQSWCEGDYSGGNNVGRHCSPGDMAYLCGGCSFCSR